MFHLLLPPPFALYSISIRHKDYHIAFEAFSWELDVITTSFMENDAFLFQFSSLNSHKSKAAFALFRPQQSQIDRRTLFGGGCAPFCSVQGCARNRILGKETSSEGNCVS